MVRIVLLSVVGVALAGLAFGQGGSIGLFANSGGTDCDVVVEPGKMLTIYFVHVNATGVCGSEFRAAPPACFNATFLSVQGAFPETFMGTLADGWIAVYFGCYNSPIGFGAMYFFTGSSTSCCYYAVQPHAVSGKIRTWDASNNELEATGGTLILNPGPTCTCNVPAHDTSWGRIKALYGE